MLIILWYTPVFDSYKEKELRKATEIGRCGVFISKHEI